MHKSAGTIRNGTQKLPGSAQPVVLNPRPPPAREVALPGVEDSPGSPRWSRALKATARTGLRAERGRLEPVRVLRDAAGLAAVMAVSLALFDQAVALCAGLGTFLGSIATYQRSWRPSPVLALASGVSLAVAVFLGHLVGAQSPLFPLVLAVWTFLAGLSWAAGPTVGGIATPTVAVMLVPATLAGSLAHATGQAAMTALGGMVPVLLTLLLPVRRWGARRDALADALTSEADYARRLREDPVGLNDPQPLMTARLAVAVTPREARRGPAELHGTLALAERLRPVLAALADPAPGVPERGAARDRIRELLDAAGLVLDAAARAVRRSGPVRVPPAARAVLTTPDTADDPLPGAARRNAARLVALLTDLVETTDSRHTAGAEEPLLRPALHRRVPAALHQMRDQCRRPASPVLRHAIRLSAVVTLCYVISAQLPLGHNYWAPLASLMVMRPEFSLTYSRAIGRIGGTLVGAALATGIVQLTHPCTVACAILTVICAGLVYLFMYSGYGLVLACASGYVVFLLAMAGEPWTQSVPDRVLLTVLGGALAMAAYALYPAWETPALHARLADWLDAAGRYAAAALDHHADPRRPPAELTRALLDVRTAWAAWRDALAKATFEPVRHRGLSDAAADEATHALRRLGRTAMLMEAQLPEHPVPAAAHLAEALRHTTEQGREALLAHRVPQWQDLEQALAAWDAEKPPDQPARQGTGLALDHLNDLSHALAEPGNRPPEHERPTPTAKLHKDEAERP